MEIDIGKQLKLEVPEAGSLSPEVANHIWRMGWHNVLMDSHANVTKASVVTDGEEVEEAEIVRRVREQSLAIAEKKLEALKSGELRVAGTRQTMRDPIELECEKIASKKLTEGLRASGKKMKDVDKDKFAAAVKMLIEQDPKITQAAKRIVAERAKGAEAIDLTQLGL
jgi:hypothetical protein